MTKQKDAIVTSQEQLTEFYRRSQDALIAGVETWAKATRELLAASKSEQDPQSMTASIDQAYTAAVAALDEQRSFMKRLISATQSN